MGCLVKRDEQALVNVSEIITTIRGYDRCHLCMVTICICHGYPNMVWFALMKIEEKSRMLNAANIVGGSD